jgi:RNA polymerase sigma factor (sigma-70 family)
LCFNAALDYKRAQSRQLSIEDPDSWLYRKEASNYDDPEQAALYAESSEDLEQLLDMLPESYRRVIVDVVLRARSYEEVADDYDMNIIAVRTRYHRAVRCLAEIVKGERLSESDLRRWLEGYDSVRIRDRLSSTQKAYS